MFQFPANPVFDQIFVPVGGPTYKWNGKAWVPFSSTISGNVNFSGSARFADGTLAVPSISWINETGSGFHRSSANNFQAGVNGAYRWGWNQNSFFMQSGTHFTAYTAAFSGATTVAGTLTLQAGNPTLVFDKTNVNSEGTISWQRSGVTRWYLAAPTSDGSGSDWAMVRCNASGAYVDQPFRIRNSDGLVQMNSASFGTAAGITAAMVGLGEVGNGRQIYNLRGSASNNIYIGWTSGQLDAQIDGSYYGTTWPINISGYAAGVKHGGTGGTMLFHWSAPGGNPTYLWGNNNDGTNQYLFQPGNLSVNYANSANYANSCDNSNKVCGLGGWSDSNPTNDPVYVWATNGGGQYHFLSNRYQLTVRWAGNVGSIHSASGGTINGRMLAHHDGWGGGGSGSAWGGMPVVSETGGGAYPGLGIERNGYMNWSIIIYYDNSLWFGSGAQSGPMGDGWAGKLDGDGNWRARGYNSYSLLLLDAQPLTGTLVDVLNIRGVRGYNPETKQQDIAVISEDVERAFPELVHVITREDGSPQGKTINYPLLIAPIIEALRELNERLTLVEARP